MDTESGLDNLIPLTTIVLSNEERDFFLDLLERDEPPSPKALAAAKRYNELGREGSEYHWQPTDNKT